MKQLAFNFLIILLMITFNFTVYGQKKLPRSENYPVSKNEMFEGKLARPILDSRRARLFRTVLREGAKKGANFAGHYTIVTWGAGLGAFSMAVVDTKTGKVYFPPFATIEGSDYGLPYADSGNNPAFRITSKLFAFSGSPDEKGEEAEGLYLYTFNNGRFRRIRFVKNNEAGSSGLNSKP